jgi:hypothetical protein
MDDLGYTTLSSLRSRSPVGVAQLWIVRRLTHHTIMNTKYKKWFEETAADPIRRRAAITDLSKQRIILFCCALVMTGCAVAMCFTTTRSPSSPALLSFAAAMSWVGVVRLDSKRQVLTLLEKFSRDEKPAA